MADIETKATEAARAAAQGRKAEPVDPRAMRVRAGQVERAAGKGPQVSKRG